MYRKVVVAQGSLVPGRKVTGSVGNYKVLVGRKWLVGMVLTLSSLASY